MEESSNANPYSNYNITKKYAPMQNFSQMTSSKNFKPATPSIEIMTQTKPPEKKVTQEQRKKTRKTPRSKGIKGVKR